MALYNPTELFNMQDEIEGTEDINELYKYREEIEEAQKALQKLRDLISDRLEVPLEGIKNYIYNN